jgi:diamine N-acetyltransferase
VLNNVTITGAVIADIPKLAAISRKTFSEAFSHLNTAENMDQYLCKNLTEERLISEMQTAGSEFYLVFHFDELIGYLKLNSGNAVSFPEAKGAMEIERIYLTAPFQGRQTGAQLLDFIFRKTRGMGITGIWLGVWEFNHGAIRFYEKHGFVRSGSHYFWLGNDRQTDVLMKKHL